MGSDVWGTVAPPLARVTLLGDDGDPAGAERLWDLGLVLPRRWEMPARCQTRILGSDHLDVIGRHRLVGLELWVPSPRSDDDMAPMDVGDRWVSHVLPRLELESSGERVATENPLWPCPMTGGPRAWWFSIARSPTFAELVGV